MRDMRTLQVVDENSGKSLGSIARGEDGVIHTDGIGQAIFEQVQGGLGWDEQESFDALVDGGWSNGYVSVRPAVPAAADD